MLGGLKVPDSQLKCVKKGVLLINQRIFIPVDLPVLARFRDLKCSPRIRLITMEEANWQYWGELQIALTYSTVKPHDHHHHRDFGNATNGQTNHQIKDFFDDGFSDHDEFAEEEVVLSDDDLVLERSNVLLETVLLEDTLEFTGRSPASDFSTPNPENLSVRVRDMEVKVRDERTLDLAIVLVVETDQQTREEAGLEVHTYRHPLSISSWPPGMAEVMEWQTAFKEEQILFRDNEILLNGELLIQVIGLEKEGDERAFTEIITKSLVSWNVNLPPGVDRQFIQGLKVNVNEIREDAGGLSVYGVLYLDMMSASLLNNEAQEQQVEQPALPVLPETHEQELLERAEPGEQVLSSSEQLLDQLFAELEETNNAELVIPTHVEPEFQPVTKLIAQSAPVFAMLLDAEPAVQLPVAAIDPAMPPSEQTESSWLNEWVTGQELEVTGMGTVNLEPAEEPSVPVGINRAPDDLAGIYSGDVDPESAELLRSFEITLGELPTLEDIMAQPESVEAAEAVETQQEQPEVKYNLTYNGKSKTRIDSPSTVGTMRQGLTKLKYINRVNLAEEDYQVSSVITEPEITVALAKPKGRWTLYLVKANDTIATISQQYCVDPEILRNRNKLSVDSLENVGSIWIPK